MKEDYNIIVKEFNILKKIFKYRSDKDENS